MGLSIKLPGKNGEVPLKKWAYLSIFVFICLGCSLFVFPHFYVRQITLWKIKSFCQKNFHAPLSYKNCLWEENRLCFEGVEIGKEGNRCQIEKATVLPSIRWKKRCIAYKISVDGMDVTLCKKKEEN